MKMYLHVRIENHWTLPLDHPGFFLFLLSPTLRGTFFSLHSAEGFLKSFVQQTAFKKKEKREEKHKMSIIWL